MWLTFASEQPLEVNGKIKEYFAVNQISWLENTNLINRLQYWIRS